MKDGKMEQNERPPGTVDDMIKALNRGNGEWIIILRQFFEALRSAWPKPRKDDH